MYFLNIFLYFQIYLNRSLFIITVVYISALCNAANILIALPYTAKSHYIMLRPIGLELARRGHNVTVITPFMEKKHPPTYHQVQSAYTKLTDANGK